MAKTARLSESSRVAMNSDVGKKMYISDETLGVGRVARNVVTETMAVPRRAGKTIETVVSHITGNDHQERGRPYPKSAPVSPRG